MSKNKKGIMPKLNKQAGSAVSLSYNIAAGLIVCPLGGFWIGKKFGRPDAGTLIGLALGFIYCGYEVWKTVRAIEENDSSDSGQNP